MSSQVTCPDFPLWLVWKSCRVRPRAPRRSSACKLAPLSFVPAIMHLPSFGRLSCRLVHAWVVACLPVPKSCSLPFISGTLLKLEPKSSKLTVDLLASALQMWHFWWLPSCAISQVGCGSERAHRSVTSARLHREHAPAAHSLDTNCH